MKRGEIWWADLGAPAGSEPGFRRPLIIVSANRLNDSALKTVLTIPVTSKLEREANPANVRLPANATGLSKPSVAIVHQISTMNRLVFIERAGRVPDDQMIRIDESLRLVLGV